MTILPTPSRAVLRGRELSWLGCKSFLSLVTCRGRVVVVIVAHVPITLVVVALVPLLLLGLPIMPARYAQVLANTLALLKDWSCSSFQTHVACRPGSRRRHRDRRCLRWLRMRSARWLLSRRQKAVNRAHAKFRARGERAIATLKNSKLLVKLRCCPRRATAIVQAILVLHHVEANRYPR